MNIENPPDPDPDPVDIDVESEPRPGSISVEVSDTQSHMTIDRETLSSLVRGVLRAEKVGRASISVAVVDDATIRAVNRRHLDHDWPTDVISFDLSDPDEGVLTGELVVSAETAAATAGRFGVSAGDELALYLVHGLLHLCGYDDTAAEDRDVIRRREGEILGQLGLSNTYPAAPGVGLVEAGTVAEIGARESARWMV